MPKIEKKYLRKSIVGLTVVACLALTMMADPAVAITPKQQFLKAEDAYAALRKRPSHQKYRDKWIACIEKYKTVYRLDSSGPWAAAGLYRSGLLYLELHKRSFLGTDKQKAIDLFREIIYNYPKSRYTPKSKSELSKLGVPIIPKETQDAAKKLESARASYDRLMKSSKKQKYRDQWEACIDRFRLAYKVDKTGPHAPESLYMVAALYDGLSQKSLRKKDRETAASYYRRVKREFPKSDAAQKARVKLGEAKSTQAVVSAPKSKDPLAEIIAANTIESKTVAENEPKSPMAWWR
jgi:tetratricopeptide (TPR) repeat protein